MNVDSYLSATLQVHSLCGFFVLIANVCVYVSVEHLYFRFYINSLSKIVFVIVSVTEISLASMSLDLRSRSARTSIAVARLPLRQLGFLVYEDNASNYGACVSCSGCIIIIIIIIRIIVAFIITSDKTQINYNIHYSVQ